MKLFKYLLILSLVFTNTGCVGLLFSRSAWCSDIKGKYYRATRVDLNVMHKEPIWILPALVDLPFALVYETVEAPFISAEFVDPRPPEPLRYEEKYEEEEREKESQHE